MPEDELVLEDHPDFVDVGTMVTWTTTFGYILNTALTRMGGGDPAAGDHMEVQFLIVSPKRGKVWDLPSMGDQVCQ